MHKKSLALDVGDAWTGIAISDALGITCRPYTTVPAKYLIKELPKIFAQEKIGTVVVGYPKTMKGEESDQTRKTVLFKEKLEKLFPDYTWVLWDERLSSKHADNLKRAKTKQEKIESHARAAAFILSTYLDFKSRG